MAHHSHTEPVTEADRREFLKALGVTGAAAAGGVTLEELRAESATADAESLASIGRAIEGDLTGRLDPGLLADSGAALAAAASELPATLQRGFPAEAEGPREEFAAVAEAGRPIYEHLAEVGFFESTTEHLPEFTPAYLESAVSVFVGTERLAEPLADLGLAGGEGVDLLAEVVANAAELETYHWAATDEIAREQIEYGEAIPAMTKGAAGGTVLWLEDLDLHLWQKAPILTEEIHAAAAWHGQSLAAGFALMAEGAREIGVASGSLSEGELAALLSTGFAVQAIAQGLLPQDVYWIDEQMRAPRRTDLGLITEY